MLQTVLQYFFFYVGLANTTGVKASIIEGVNVFVAVLVASLLFQQEKLTGKKIVGCLIGFAGVVIVNLGGSMDMGFRLTGEGFIFQMCIRDRGTGYHKQCNSKYGDLLYSEWAGRILFLYKESAL